MDLLARWQATKDLSLGLNLNNLFDRKYYERSFNSVWVMPGSGPWWPASGPADPDVYKRQAWSRAWARRC